MRAGHARAAPQPVVGLGGDLGREVGAAVGHAVPARSDPLECRTHCSKRAELSRSGHIRTMPISEKIAMGPDRPNAACTDRSSPDNGARCHRATRATDQTRAHAGPEERRRREDQPAAERRAALGARPGDGRDALAGVGGDSSKSDSSPPGPAGADLQRRHQGPVGGDHQDFEADNPDIRSTWRSSPGTTSTTWSAPRSSPTRPRTSSTSTPSRASPPTACCTRRRTSCPRRRSPTSRTPSRRTPRSAAPSTALPLIASARTLFYQQPTCREGRASPRRRRPGPSCSTDAKKISAEAGGVYGYGMPLGSEEAQAETSIWIFGAGGSWGDSETLTIDTPQNVEARALDAEDDRRGRHPAGRRARPTARR